MTDHLSAGQIGRYTNRAMSAEEVLALHDHLELCAHCRDLVAASTRKKLEAAFSHLSESEMVAFAAGRMDRTDRALAEQHLIDCDLCRESVIAMQSARSGRPSRAWISAVAAIAALILIAVLLRRPPQSRPAPPLASLRDGGAVLSLDISGTLKGLETDSAEDKALVHDALLSAGLPAAPVFTRQTPDVLLAPAGPAPQDFGPVSPLDRRVLSDRPTFEWRPRPGASRYQVLVTNEKLDPLARSPQISETRWQPDAALPRGIPLLWQVRAWRGDDMVSAPAPPAPPARFEIAPAEVAARIAAAKSHLLAAILCARNGLTDEARLQLQALAAENPGSPLVYRLQSSLSPKP